MAVKCPKIIIAGIVIFDWVLVTFACCVVGTTAMRKCIV
jgi:hypothetical protein